MTFSGKAAVGQEITLHVLHNGLPVAGAVVRQVEPAAPVGQVNASSALHVRSGPDLKSRSLTLIPRDYLLTVLAQTGDWFKVRLQDGTEVYSFASYITLQEGSQ